ncbi:xylosidase/arabinosidase [Reticulomyxa filosa]|uniref:Xylosidase/arabinosidase n=1 Tax=Reticulomyxa filosa TaxID=46433 RepID=X6NXM7_RETFI|nr:xylosidase/arabinosidase [Reticulomyxa filosa]|eukprot:ETO30027.1 xylosidase/arabinosidase [Reticulomyxa filosa]
MSGGKKKKKFCSIDQIPEAIDEGMLTEDEVNQAFARLFTVRIRLGLLDPPTFVEYNYLKNDSSVEGTAHVEMSRVIAGHSVCMYKNNKRVLPLSANAIKKLVVIGPQAIGTDLLLGNYGKITKKKRRENRE